MPGGAHDDDPIEQQRPILEVVEIRVDAVDEVLIAPRFAAQAAHLGEAGDARFDEAATR